jgi:prepilin-type N-terminal cleavage/methylation domain-containing protein/prepilin-type processing-associated H-X9-DG protein
MLKKAFTLIELLVVIAIIAILAAILFPVFAQAKDAAKKTQSISNVKQIGTATMLYSGDYDDMYSHSAYITPPEGVDPRPVVFSVYDAHMPYMKNKQIFMSPGDALKQNWKGRINLLGLTTPTNGVDFASYSPNLGLFGEYTCALGPAGSKSQLWSQTALPDVVNTIAFFDGYIKQNLAANGGLRYNNFMGITRHTEGVVIAFADGHAKFWKWNGVANISNELTPTGANRVGVKYYNWSTPLVKGEGQLETVANTFAAPYNDLHGVPGTAVGDSEDQACP